MRKFHWFVVALAVGGSLLPLNASAKSFSIGKHDVATVRRACGTSFQPAADGTGYGCSKDCKNSQGQTVKKGCQVACDNNNNCTGQTPDRIKIPAGTRSLTGVLTGFAGVDAGPKRKPRTDTVLNKGLLEGGGTMGTGGPAATGSPLSTGGASSPPPGKIY